MKQNKIVYFWIGFIASATATAWLYWLWRKSRVVTPTPLVISRSESSQPEVKGIIAGTIEADVSIGQTGVSQRQPDDLGTINGIGPATVRRLNEAGVYTFKQLGNLSPKQLGKIAGNNRWDPEDWIDQAKKLAG